MSTDRLAYREGNRIRHERGFGYGDAVTDAAIIRHAIGHMDEGNPEMARWCLAVIDLRLAERAAVVEQVAS